MARQHCAGGAAATSSVTEPPLHLVSLIFPGGAGEHGIEQCVPGLHLNAGQVMEREEKEDTVSPT